MLIAVIGGFDAEDAALTAAYLQVQAVALPFYALSTYLQKVCSSLMRMKFYAIATCVAAVVQVTFCIVLTPVYGLYVVPFSSTFFFIAVDVVTILNVRREIGSLGLSSVVSSCVRGLVFGLLGRRRYPACLQHACGRSGRIHDARLDLCLRRRNPILDCVLWLVIRYA